ncbi:YrdB family protein [Actinomadura scrupuli]|uniref:YrdB family protein n=1 Tax=Actinomadura scrupuli TaxID=559629 RepID=UPI003D96C524
MNRPDAQAWTPVTAVNAGLAFALEMGLLAALCFWGVRTGGGVVGKTLLGVGTPVLAAALWGLFLAAGGPRYAIPVPAQIALKLALFGAAAMALHRTGHTTLGIAFGVLAVLCVSVEYLTR